MAEFAVEYIRLNDRQQEAVDALDGPVMVIAGPGTGKTQLLSMRVANILQRTDTDPANILCLTFTEAAARNMRERLLHLIGPAAQHVGIYTYHGFGSDIIQRYPEYFEESPLLKAIDDLTAYETLRAIFEELPHANPLSLRLDDDFLHLRSLRTAISWFKQAGLSANDIHALAKQNDGFIDVADKLVAEVFEATPSPKHITAYQKLLDQLCAYHDPSSGSYSLTRLCSDELREAIESLDPNGRYAKPITAWRNKWLIQNHLKQWGMCDKKRTRILHAVANVYQKFQDELAKHGYYTYDDMILRTIQALQKHEELQLTLQEQYQYVLVDEYQDTNGAQNRLLELLADSPVNERRPNLMVVGDDDQAIYRFQGAHMSIMLDFLARWKDVKKIVLTDNYRSDQRILDLARHVVLQGTERLEAAVPGLTKDITAATIPDSVLVTRPQTVSELDQYSYVAKQIAHLIQQGTRPENIAVLAPKHTYLEALVPYLADAKIPLKYERREHILEQPRIQDLLNFAAIIVAVSRGDWGTTNALMPQLLSSEYLEIPPSEILAISLEAYRNQRTWFEILLAHKRPELRTIAEAIASLAKLSLHTPLELIFDQLIGTTPVRLEDKTTWTSPYKEYYFSEQRLETAPQDYLKLLGQLTTLRNTVREYHPNERLTLSDLLTFVNLYRQSNLPLVDTNPHNTDTSAVELLTAYKAKGLEWDCVFLLGCHNNTWGPKTRSGNNSFSLPTNLQWIKPARDSADDRLRLFYVALTRAKKQLYLMEYSLESNGKNSEPLSWLVEESPSIPKAAVQEPFNTKEVATIHEISWTGALDSSTDLKSSIAPWLDTYQISATHLNDFLDVTKGGPKHFMLQHMLHFPQTLRPSSIFGSAMHEALHYAHVTMSTTGKLPGIAKVREVFRERLLKSALTEQDEQHLIERGNTALEQFICHSPSGFLPTDKSEYNFKNEGARVGAARLTGKLDVIRELSKNQYEIIDYKTGSPMESWKPKGSPYSLIRAYLYQKQLDFYGLLMKGSSHFKNADIQKGTLQFIEPTADSGELLQLSYQLTPDSQTQTAELVQIVWKHIISLDFPDTSNYSLDIKGVKAFEADLLDGKI